MNSNGSYTINGGAFGSAPTCSIQVAKRAEAKKNAFRNSQAGIDDLLRSRGRKPHNKR